MYEFLAPLFPSRSALRPPLGACGADCWKTRPVWHRFLRSREAAILDGVSYCRPACLQDALIEKFTRLCNQKHPPPPPNRMPLGLLMVARGTLTYTEVLAALEAQRRAGCGRIGDWIEKLGFASEQSVTAALGIQWGCPVTISLEPESIPPSHHLPLSILERFCMIPLHYVVSTNTLVIVFGERVDHATLYAIESILKCRTQPCAGGRRHVTQCIERQGQGRDFEFGPMTDPAEMARISASYIGKFGAEEARLGRVGPIIWLRLRALSAYANVTFRLPDDRKSRTSAVNS